jgi:glycerol-3-phosphate acyltransferase PlsY
MNSQVWIYFLGTYLLGAVPTAYLLVRLMTGEDIRVLGDGNVGAKNTFVSVSKWLGFSIAGIDITKGWIVISAGRLLGFNEGTILIAGAAVVIGHDFSIFLNLQGGQGMAATVGVFLALFPQITLGAFLAFLVFLALTRHWDLSSVLAFFLLVLFLWITGRPGQQIIFVMLLLPWIALSKMIQNWQKRRLAI